MRGKQKMSRTRNFATRITPAGAGKTQTVKLCLYFVEDHPRRCGENYAYINTLKSAMGSPPQVRGKRCLRAHGIARQGITPAGAGKTGFVPLLGGVAGDHPRRCGENRQALRVPRSRVGSPPQVRGKQENNNVSNLAWGITPAGAGKT